MLRIVFTVSGHTAEFRINRGEIEASNLPNRPGLYIAHDFHVHYGGSILSQAVSQMSTLSQASIL
ncbi:hypothetical protein DPMN_009581 [Dreissena polymorpha]|uniref:Uncharacterized protein n=1 Tax=Dreissena polymorpha TaxID=45954 RepID=A0A9D4RY84_DREPO|nr:hypothetical protein DPMN_009581 [Dreissena polymorpha]